MTCRPGIQLPHAAQRFLAAIEPHFVQFGSAHLAGNFSFEDGQKQAADQLAKNPKAKYIQAVPGIFALGVAQRTSRSSPAVWSLQVTRI